MQMAIPPFVDLETDSVLLGLLSIHFQFPLQTYIHTIISWLSISGPTID